MGNLIPVGRYLYYKRLGVNLAQAGICQPLSHVLFGKGLIVHLYRLLCLFPLADCVDGFR